MPRGEASMSRLMYDSTGPDVRNQTWNGVQRVVAQVLGKPDHKKISVALSVDDADGGCAQVYLRFEMHRRYLALHEYILDSVAVAIAAGFNDDSYWLPAKAIEVCVIFSGVGKHGQVYDRYGERVKNGNYGDEAVLSVDYGVVQLIRLLDSDELRLE